MKRIAEQLFQLLNKYGGVVEEDKEVYLYGLEVVIHNFISLSLPLLICISNGYALEGIIMLLIFSTNQSIGGGYHASSHKKCLIVMIVLSAVFCLSFSLHCVPWLYLIISVACIAILYINPLVLHKNKQYLSKNSKETLVRKSRLLSLIMLVVMLILFVNVDHTFMHTCTFSLVASSLSRLCARITKEVAC